MKLYARITDRESYEVEKVELCEFPSSTYEGEKVFVELVERHGEEMFKIVADEGYSHTEYFYPVRRYTITHIEVLR